MHNIVNIPFSSRSAMTVSLNHSLFRQNEGEIYPDRLRSTIGNWGLCCAQVLI